MAETDVTHRPAPTEEEGRGKPFGPVAAAFVAAGIGAAVLGIVTTLAEASASIKDKLELSARVGPLSGKTVVTVIVYFVVWAILGIMWRGKEVDPKKVFIWTAVLVGIGVVLTFPTFFQAFAPEE